MKNRTFAVRLSSERVRLAVCGICEEGMEEICEGRLRTADIPGFDEDDVVDTDLKLAKMLEDRLSGYAMMAGASLNAGKEGGSTGGVIGKLGEGPESSEDEVEDLENGFVMYSRPEGPGFIADITLEEARRAAGLIAAAERTEERWKALMRALEKARIAIAAADGTGKGSRGRVLAKHGEKEEILEV